MSTMTPTAPSLPARIWRRLRAKGLADTLTRGWYQLAWQLRAWSLGVRTDGSIDGHLLSDDPSHLGYQPIDYQSFIVALRYVPVRPGIDGFLDYGCGLGRAVILAAERPFRRVYGIEQSAELCAAARDNVRRARPKLGCPSVEIVHGDAREFPVPPDVNVAFLFNPFTGPAIRAVLDRLRESFVAHPRPLWIIYAVPAENTDPFVHEPWLKLRHLPKTANSHWQRLAVYEAVAPRASADPAATPVTIRRVPVADLTPEQLAVWSALQRDHAEYSSPYFHPAFTQAVAAVRDDVEVAVFERAGEPVGFFPYQRSERTGQAVGGRLNDAHGPIVRPGETWDVPALLRACDLSRWDFHHLTIDPAPWSPYILSADTNVSIHAEGGLDAYAARRPKQRSEEIKKVDRLRRKAERTLGPVRVEHGVRDPRLLETLFHWKSRQYRNSGATDVFSFAWTRALLERLHREENTAAFGGRLSAAWLGDRLAALLFGLRAGPVLHVWFPVYDPELSDYSPGNLLLIETIRAAPELGLKRLDLGRLAAWKNRFVTDSAPLYAGTADLSPLRRWFRAGVRQRMTWLRSTPLGALGRTPARWLRKIRERVEFE